MKYYDTNFDEYQQSKQNYNIHPELNSKIDSLPQKKGDINNIILYGPCGVGKYNVALSIINRYSNTNLKHDKKISIFSDKVEKKAKNTRDKKSVQSYSRRVDFVYKMSDIHYEIDFSLLGCNAKTLWNEIFFQLIDIISVNQFKFGFILCKNFHCIYNEFLDVFHSYINDYSHMNNITLKFILLTEQISFLPNNVLHYFEIIRVKRPSVDKYMNMMQYHTKYTLGTLNKVYNEIERQTIKDNIEMFGSDCLDNLKEIHILKYAASKIPKTNFNIILDELIDNILNPNKLDIQNFRNILYDILIYNLDIFECMTHIVFYSIHNNLLSEKNVQLLLAKLYTFFKYYNNNYRPIYHIESIMFDIIVLIHYS